MICVISYTYKLPAVVIQVAHHFNFFCTHNWRQSINLKIRLTDLLIYPVLTDRDVIQDGVSLLNILN